MFLRILKTDFVDLGFVDLLGLRVVLATFYSGVLATFMFLRILKTNLVGLGFVDRLGLRVLASYLTGVLASGNTGLAIGIETSCH